MKAITLQKMSEGCPMDTSCRQPPEQKVPIKPVMPKTAAAVTPKKGSPIQQLLEIEKNRQKNLDFLVVRANDRVYFVPVKRLRS